MKRTHIKWVGVAAALMLATSNLAANYNAGLGVGTGLRFYSFSESVTVGNNDLEASINSTMVPIQLSFNHLPQGMGFILTFGGSFSLGNSICASVNDNENCIDLDADTSGLEGVAEGGVSFMPTYRFQNYIFGLGLEATRTVFMGTVSSTTLTNLGFRAETGYIPDFFPVKIHLGFTYNPFVIDEAGNFSLDAEDSTIAATQLELGVSVILGDSKRPPN